MGLVPVASLPAAESPDRQFREAAWPVLKQRCLSCHGETEQEGALRLDSREAALKGGEQGPAISPGSASDSLLMKAVRRVTKEQAMPPKEELSAREIAALEAWINNGAPWPKEMPSAAPAASPGERIGNAWEDKRNPIVRLFDGERLDLWSLKPIAAPPLPAVVNSAWPVNALDHFILARLEQEQLAPRSAAERRALCRRVTYDLTGLPPTAQEVDAFMADSRQDAYEQLVERLLASPRYGEHQARWWLDVVRYSDSNGFDWDEFRPRAYLFRDYVVRAFSADKPFDQFVIEQLAGDELLEGPPQTTAQRDALLATAYLRIGPQDNSASLFNEQSRARHEWMSDLTETTASAFLGLTMSCCRCHDHKFDPLSQADHFRLRAFFEPLKYADDLPINLAEEQSAIRQHNEQLDQQIKAVEAPRRLLHAEIDKRLLEAKTNALSQAEQDLLHKKADELASAAASERAKLAKRLRVTDEERSSARTAAEKEQDDKFKQEVDRLSGEKRKYDYALLATDRRGESTATHLLHLGDHKSPREQVSAGFISALDPNPAELPTPPSSLTHGRRLALAKWITDGQNPLTARVIVNRLWQQHFGQGLVATPNDFGLAGARPTHPELLDYLATDFMQSGWSIKRLHYTIVTSATYRQGANKAIDGKPRDTADELYAGQRLRRLTAEQLRDSLLAVAGLLNTKTEGKAVWPELPAEILQANPAFLDDNAEKTKGWYPSPAEDQDCRSLLLVQKRTVRIPFLETFDLPENTTSCARRNVSTVAPQAFALLNSPLAIKAAKALAERVEREAADTAEARVRTAFKLALQRSPTQEELARSVTFVEEQSLTAFCRVLLNLNEFAYVE